MGRYGYYVIDADGHGGEPPDWRTRIPDQHRDQMLAWLDRTNRHFRDLPGGGNRLDRDELPEQAGTHHQLLIDPGEMRAGMYEPTHRIEDMDLEGIDVAVNFVGGNGEEWAMRDRDFAVALCRTLNDARVEYAAHNPARLKCIAKVPLIDPEAAAEELHRAVTELGCVGVVTPQHVLDKNLDDPSFDVVWAEAERLGVPVCVHGGGGAPDQVPFAIERFSSRLGKHAITHPVGAMLALYSFTVGGILHRYPGLKLAIMEAGCGWLPYWLERLDEHYELMPEQAPVIDRAPSEYFLEPDRGFVGVESEDSLIPFVMHSVGAGLPAYASDYCHFDCAFPNTVKIIADRTDLTDDEKRAVLSGNASKLYGIPVP